MQSELIKISVNGEPRTVPSNQSVSTLLKSLKIVSDRVAVELNKSIVRSRDWEKTRVPNGSNIEIVEFVGGG